MTGAAAASGVRHIVCFAARGEDATARRESAETIQRELRTLSGRVEQLRHLEVGLDLQLVDGHWDAVLITDFDSVEDLDAYQGHPAHLEVVGRIGPLIAQRAVVDFRF